MSVNLPKDQNRVTAAGGVWNDGSGTIVPLPIDPTTGRLLVTAIGGSSVSLEVNGVPNGSQTLLNLVAGTNVTLTDDGSGDITIASTGGGSTTWDAIQNPAGNQALTMGTDTTTWTWTGGLSAAWDTNGNQTVGTTTAATSGNNYNSAALNFQSNGWIGGTPASTADIWKIQNTLGTGTNPSSILSISHTSGTTGVSYVQVGVFLNLVTGATAATGTASIRASSGGILILSSSGTNSTRLNFDSGTGGVGFYGGTNGTLVNSFDSSGNTIFQNPTAATSGANQSSPTFKLQGNAWNGASINDYWQWQNVLGTGTNPTSTLTLTHSGTTGTLLVTIPSSLTLTGGGTLTIPGTASTFGGLITNPATVGINGTLTTSVLSSTNEGRVFQVHAGTLTRSADTGTYTQSAVNSFGIPTLQAGAATTYTNASTLYIAGNPVASTNVTITNGWGLYLDNGANLFVGGSLTLGTALSPANGGTGVNNGSATITLAGNLVTTGAFNTTFAQAATTTVTLPSTSSTMARTDAAQTFTGTQTFSQVIKTANAITATSNAATIPVTSGRNIVTNNSAATLTITLTTSGAVNMQTVIVQILDFSAAAQTITWVGTENSTVTAPTTSNGSTTLPLTVGFIYNSATSKWRCIASA